MLARPTSTTKPIWVKILMSSPAMFTPMTALSRHIGTTRMIASGSDQLSYWAASTRKTMTTAKPKTIIAVLPAWSSRIGQLGPLRGHRLEQLAARPAPASIAIASPELTPAAAAR